MITWKNSKTKSSALILDIASGSVGAGIALLDKNSSPKIVYTVRHGVFLEDGSDPVDFEKVTRLTIKKILEKVFKKGLPILQKESSGRSLDKVVVVLSSPWSRSHVFNREIIQSQNFTFDEEFVTTLIQEEAKRFSENEEIYEKVLVSLRLNGYETPVPLSRHSDGKAKSVSANLI